LEVYLLKVLPSRRLSLGLPEFVMLKHAGLSAVFGILWIKNNPSLMGPGTTKKLENF